MTTFEHTNPPLREGTLANEAETAALASALSHVVAPGDVLCLWGDLGAGKSTFARALIRALAGQGTEAPSPTFTLVQTYEAPDFEIAHFDLYRLEAPEDVLELGIEDAFSDSVSIVEWPDRLGPYLPWDRLDVLLSHESDTVDGGRHFALHATDGRWADKLNISRG